MRGKHAMSQSVAWKREFPQFLTNNPLNHFDNQKNSRASTDYRNFVKTRIPITRFKQGYPERRA